MTPNNPTNNQPLIYRIADALGVFHLVAPVNHTHAPSEIDGLDDVIDELFAGLNEKANTEDVNDALAGKQNVLTFDSTPTADSTNPVTSGGVKAAIDDATKAAFISSMPYIITATHEKMRVYTRILKNTSGVTMTTNECLDFSTLPPAERVNIYWNAASVDIAPNESFGIRFMRFATGVYVWYDGKFEF